MTNQNDTQDEAERIAWKVECSKAWFSKTPEEFHEYIFKQGYRAGVASLACKHPGCACVCGHQGKCPEDGPIATGGTYE